MGSPARFEVAGARLFLDFALVQKGVTQSDFNLLVFHQPIIARAKQHITSASRGFGGFPMAGLLVFEQVGFQVIHRLGILRHHIKDLNQQTMRFNRHFIPKITAWIFPIHAHFLVFQSALFERSHDFLRRFFVHPFSVEVQSQHALHIVGLAQPIFKGLSFIVFNRF